MRPLAMVIWVAVSVALMGGCGATEQGIPADETAERTGYSSRDHTPKTSRTSDAGEEDGKTEPGGGEGTFVSSSGGRGGVAGAADRIRGVRLRVFEDYERVLIDFGRRGGEASGIPTWSLGRPAEGGYVRLDFPGVSSTAIGGEDFVGLVVDELFVVRDPEGGLFVDVFAMGDFLYRVAELPGGKLAVDFRRAEGGIDHPVVRGDEAVVLQPREAEEVSSPLVVKGYSRLFEARTAVSLLDRDGEVISSAKVRADDHAPAWSPYEATLRFSGYEGLATLRVGDGGPRDGPFEVTETQVIVEGNRHGPGR